MKKLYTTALALLCAITAFAQTNRTYSVPGLSFGDYNSNAWIDPDLGGGDYFTGGVRTNNSPYIDSLMILKVDGAYNPMMNFVHQASLWTHRIISTADDGILLVAHGNMGSGWGVNIIKFDMNLNPMWQDMIPVTTGPTIWTRIDVESVIDPNTGMENYYILYGDNLNPSYPYDHQINLARFDQNGAFMWNFQYKRQVSPDIYESPSGITSYIDPNTGNPLIVMVGSNGDAFGQYNLWGMTVDDNGSIVTPYTEITTVPAELEWPDVVYDGQDLAITYLQENNGTSIPGATANASFIGIIKTDVNFAPIYTTLHWITCENYGLGISVAADGNYIVSGWNSWCSAVDLDSSPVIMKIDRGNGMPIWTNVYNLNRNTQSAYYGRHVQDVNGFIHMAYNADIPSIPSNEVRLLVTNPIGTACGVRRVRPESAAISPTTTTYTYDVNPSNAPGGLGLSPFQLPINFTECTDADGSYRLNETAATTATVTLAPTLLHSGDRLTCTIAANETATAEVTITNLLGQRVHSSSHPLTTGSNSFAIPATLATGLHMVLVTVDGKALHTQKINVVD